MSKQIEIKAWRLKFCPTFFRFEYKGKASILFGPSLKMVLCKYVDGDGQYVNIDQNDTVRVWADSYEAAVVERIVEMIGSSTLIVFAIQKTKREGLRAFIGACVNQTMAIPVKVDPRPNEEEYIIEINP